MLEREGRLIFIQLVLLVIGAVCNNHQGAHVIWTPYMCYLLAAVHTNNQRLLTWATF